MLAIGHLRHGFGRNEANGIHVFESRLDQRLQVMSLQFGGNLPAQPLPRVTRAFDQFHDTAKHRILWLLKEFFRAVEKASPHWRVFIAAKSGEFLELAALLGIQPRRYLDN